MKQEFIKRSFFVIVISFILIQFIVGLNSSSKTFLNNEKSKLDMNLYHTTQEIYQNIRNLMNNKCKSKMKETKMTEDINSPFYNILSIFTLTNYSLNKNKLKVFIISGEHARELISVELVYYIITILCEEDSNLKYFFIIVSF